MGVSPNNNKNNISFLVLLNPIFTFEVSYRPTELTRLALQVIASTQSLIHELFHAVLAHGHVVFAYHFSFGQCFTDLSS